MTTLIRRVAVSVITLGLLAACTGAPSTTAVPTAPQVTSPPLPSVALPSFELPSFVPDQLLEDLFPDELGGQPLSVRSASGQTVVNLLNEDDPYKFNEFLGDIGASIDQVSVAIAFSIIPHPSGTTDPTGASILALRVQGASGAAMLERLAAAVQEDVENVQIGSTTIGRKNVTSIEDPDSSAYLYAVGEVVFMVGGTPALVEEAFTKLP